LPPDRAPSLAPEELRRGQLAAMTAWVLAGARSQPVALAFEDLHWADPTSLDLMQALAERGAQAPLFVLATTRPEFRSPWSLRAQAIPIKRVAMVFGTRFACFVGSRYGKRSKSAVVY